MSNNYASDVIERQRIREANGELHKYNVTLDLASWARTKVNLWDTEQRLAIWQELTRLDREEHGRRCEARRLANSINHQ